MIAGGVTQLNIMIGTMIASMQPGAVSQLYYADRLYELPLAIVGIAIGVVLLPDVSRHLRAGNHDAVMDSQTARSSFAMLLTVPAAAALAVIPSPIVSVLFERGAFTATDTAQTSQALWIFALGLPAFVMIKVFSPAYFAREDTKTPMRYASLSLTANTGGLDRAVLRVQEPRVHPAARHCGCDNSRRVAQRGIAVVDAEGARCISWRDARLGSSLVKVLVSSAIMGAVLVLAAQILAPWLASNQASITRGRGARGVGRDRKPRLRHHGAGDGRDFHSPGIASGAAGVTQTTSPHLGEVADIRA